MSKVEVNQVTQQCGTTLTVGGGACKTAVVDATTVTLGRCGGTVSLASGATQSGFGRTGTVDWDTSNIKTGTFTAVTGTGYFVNTAAAIATVNLPAGVAGSIVAISDYTRTFATYNCTVAPNGAEKIGGVAEDAPLNVDGQSATFVYVDGTEGWININETQTSVIGQPNEYITATVSGACNTLTTAPDCGNYKVANFVAPGTFCVSAGGGLRAKVDYLVIAGGAGGGAANGGGGGGGAGGSRTSFPSPAGTLELTIQGYPISVGGGGTGAPASGPSPGTAPSSDGTNSSFSTITSAGGGGGGSGNTVPNVGADGGSGGGGAKTDEGSPGAGGSGNIPATPVAQGTDGGVGGNNAGGGGGGISSVGSNASSPSAPSNGGAGGNGIANSITGSPLVKAGGGGGNSESATGGSGGPGGGGAGASGSGTAGIAGTANSGGGGGGADTPSPLSGGNGGSGIVTIRYRFQ